tara:strand:+ start:172 stop:552 length:381 start_codon:yes stop_codon:yes gene_type:complete
VVPGSFEILFNLVISRFLVHTLGGHQDLFASFLGLLLVHFESSGWLSLLLLFESIVINDLEHELIFRFVVIHFRDHSGVLNSVWGHTSILGQEVFGVIVGVTVGVNVDGFGRGNQSKENSTNVLHF